MSPTLDRDDLHLPSVALLVVLVVFAVGAFALTDDLVSPMYAISLAIAVGFLAVTSFQTVREHELYHLGTSVVVTVLFAIWWAESERPALLPALVVALGAFAVLVELYNYRNGTTHLRLDT